MTTWRRYVGLVLAWCVLFPWTTFAQNNTAEYAVPLTIGQNPIQLALGASPNTERWYRIEPRQGRSYCTELTSDTSFNYEFGDPAVTVYAANGTTEVVTNSDIVTEPRGYLQSRACWMQSSHAEHFIKTTQYTTANRSYILRVVETTLWCAWFFIDGDYNAFTLLTNTTDSAVNITVTWRDAAGATVGTFSGSIPGNGNLALNARTYVTTATSGSVAVLHNGSPQAIQGSTTTLSGTTGVGFDAPFGQRRPW